MTGIHNHRIETGECRFCPSPIEVYDEGTPVPVHQILGDHGEVYLVCASCWWNAIRRAPADDVTARAGVYVLHAHS